MIIVCSLLLQRETGVIYEQHINYSNGPRIPGRVGVGVFLSPLLFPSVRLLPRIMFLVLFGRDGMVYIPQVVSTVSLTLSGMTPPCSFYFSLRDAFLLQPVL